MEESFFFWEGWDAQDTMAFTFYKVKLKRDIGNFPAGTEFDSAFVDYEKGVLEFYRRIPGTEKPNENYLGENEVAGTFTMKLEISE